MRTETVKEPRNSLTSSRDLPKRNFRPEITRYRRRISNTQATGVINESESVDHAAPIPGGMKASGVPFYIARITDLYDNFAREIGSHS
jgi:hypothetical protein